MIAVSYGQGTSIRVTKWLLGPKGDPTYLFICIPFEARYALNERTTRLRLGIVVPQIRPRILGTAAAMRELDISSRLHGHTRSWYADENFCATKSYRAEFLWTRARARQRSEVAVLCKLGTFATRKS